MEKWKGKVALVTGGSKGIGAAVTCVLVEHGLVVYACARDTQLIDELQNDLMEKPGKLLAVKCDLQKEDDILAMFSLIKRDHGGVDVLVNNAGISTPCDLLSAKTEDMHTMTNINILAPCICSREAVKQMKEKGSNDGQIININSTSGHRVSSKSYLHFYSATKHALTALTEGLRSELKQEKSRIRVTSLSPGVTETPGLLNFQSEEEKEKVKERLGGIVMDPKDVAGAVITVLSSPSHVQIHELMIRPLWH